MANVTGGDDGFKNRKDILEYREGDGWKKVGAMKKGKSDHAILPVKYGDFKDYCN